MSLSDRFAKRIADLAPTQSGCLEWPGARHRQGYGQIRYAGSTVLAHRVAYEAKHGPIPDGLHVMHRCDNPSCVNVEHLSLGTHADNMADRQRKGRTVLPPRASGEACPWARLRAADAALIRYLADCGVKQHRIGQMFGISQTMVSRIRLRKTWARVPDLEAP